jgi:predicted nucleic acid-binding protein
MAYNIFVDSDIIIDFLVERELFFKDAKLLFSFATLDKIKLHTSTLIYANVFYILRKEFPTAVVKSKLIELSKLVQIVNTTNQSIYQSFESDFSDFEDAIQYHTALESKCTFFITRNTKDYKKAKNMRVLTAAQFCKLFVK